MALVATLLLALVPQQAEVPFTLELPEGYEAFAPTPGRPGSWSARRGDGQAQVMVSHYDLGMPGAQLGAVLEDIATRKWRPMLAQLPDTSLERWSGEIGGLEAGGWEVRYRNGERAMAISERLALAGDRMVVLVWDGPEAAREGMESSLASLVVPAAWLPLPPPQVDPARGLGGGLPLAFPGSLRVEVDLRGFAEAQELAFLVVHEGEAATPNGGWRLPLAAVRADRQESDPAASVRYRLKMDEDHGLGASYGITRLPGQTFAALDPLWLALPEELAASGRNYAPPAWSLRAFHSAHLRVMTARPVETVFQESDGTMVSTMAALEAGRAWPFLVLGEYRLRRDDGVDWWLRLDAKARTPEEVVRAWKALEASATKLWGVDMAPTLASYPYVGDRVLPGLLLLDEEQGWFDRPMDGSLDSTPRLVALARLVAQQRFGARLRGSGTATQFLERSLAEFAAARLLETSGLSDAEALAAELRADWRNREEEAGELPLPLSLLPIEDLYGPRRLLSFGPLVWEAIEGRIGREAFDAMLRKLLTEPRRWSCADLESLLAAAAPEADWESFLRASVYGRELPRE